MTKPTLKIRLLRLIWGIIPWLMVAAIGAFIVFMFVRITEKQIHLAQAKKAAIKKEIPAVKVITLTLTPHHLEDKIGLPAQVEPYEDLQVKAELFGQVLEVLVEEGQRVKKGQILVRLDDRDYQSRLEQIEANYKLAKLEYARISKLAKQKITAVSKLDEVEARLHALKAQKKEAQLALSRSIIKAPISGRLNEVQTKLGDLLSVGDPVAQILQYDKVKVTVGVPESDVAAVFDLKKARVIIEALNNRSVMGRKVFLSRKPRTLARLYDLELMVPNPDEHILPGMFAKVELVKEVFDQALTIPLYAVIVHGSERFVYVEKDGHAEKRTVSLGVLDKWQVQVKTGLNPGDKVVVVGHRFLDQGQNVEVIKNVSHPREIFES